MKIKTKLILSLKYSYIKLQSIMGAAKFVYTKHREKNSHSIEECSNVNLTHRIYYNIILMYFNKAPKKQYFSNR